LPAEDLLINEAIDISPLSEPEEAGITHIIRDVADKTSGKDLYCLSNLCIVLLAYFRNYC
jgi:hypothetical protein